MSSIEELTANQRNMQDDIIDIKREIKSIDSRFAEHEKQDEHRFTKIETTILLVGTVIVILVPLLTKVLLQ